MKSLARAFFAHFGPLSLVFGVLAILAEPAGADVKIVSRVTVAGGARPSPAQTVTTCYKGEMVRTESDHVISLYNSKTQSVITLNKDSKTYRVLALKSAFSAAPGVLSRLQFRASADMQPTDETAVIGGYPARKYVGKATFAVSVLGAPPNSIPETSMEIEQWATESVSLPPGATDMANPFLRMAGPLQQMKGMEPLMKAMSQVKGMPLSNRFTITPGSAAGAARGPITTTNDVESVSMEPLDAAMFQIPAGFTKVESKAIPEPPAALRARQRANGSAARPQPSRQGQP